MSYPNIALTGKFRSGKDEVARYLSLKYGYYRFAFGDEIKRLYHDIFGHTDAKPREGYQWFGQTMRERDPNIWVNKCFDKIEKDRAYERIRYERHGIDAPGLRVVITDLRQPNEYERCRSERFVIIRITAPDHMRIERAQAAGDAFTLEDLIHDTEQHVDSYEIDYEIDNSSSLDDLYRQIDQIMKSIGK